MVHFIAVFGRKTGRSARSVLRSGSANPPSSTGGGTRAAKIDIYAVREPCPASLLALLLAVGNPQTPKSAGSCRPRPVGILGGLSQRG